MLHKLRSLLTMLGMVFGVLSVVVMLAIGEGASAEAIENIRRLGSQNIIIHSVQPAEDEGGSSQRVIMSMYGLLYEDIDRMVETFPEVDHVVPVKQVRKEGRLGERTEDLRLVGTTPMWFDLVQRPVIAGRTLREGDMAGSSNVVVLTEYGARRLLATQEAIGQTLRLGGDMFEVVGIVRSDEADAGGIQTPDDRTDAYIPLKAARERFGDLVVERTPGGMQREMIELHRVIVRVTSIEDVEPVAAGIARMLETHHRRKDYRMDVPLALLRQAEETRRLFNFVLGSIAGISLLVGGIGIMNIMLASVTERTREIGVRRAIGAKRKQIIGQFLIETVVLSVVGGVIGMLLGIAIPAGVTLVAGMPTVVTVWSLVLSVGISVSVGVVFGIYPAIRAANLDPIIALRHE